MSELSGFTEADEREWNAAFIEGMDRLDRMLLSEGIPVPGRPLHAMRRIAMARGVELVMGGPDRSPTADVVSRWYDERYGNRLNVDFSPGRAVLVVRGDPLVMRLPLVIGQWDGILAVTKLLPGLTQPMFAGLKEGEMQDIIAALPWMQERFAAIDRLPRPIRANLDAAIMQMTSQSPHYGESRWASLQFAEKAMKHLLRAKKRTPPHTHDLTPLLDGCEAVGLPRGLRVVVAMVQCGAGVRYEEDSTLDAALAAHHASIDLAAHVASHLAGNSTAGPAVEQQDLADLVLSANFGIETSHDGNLLFVLAMGHGSYRRLLLSGDHCGWLRTQLLTAMAQGRHPDPRHAFETGRDLRNAPPRHPLRLFHIHLPPFGPEVYQAEVLQAKSIRAHDAGSYIVLEIEAVKGAPIRLIVWSELVPMLVEMIRNGLAEGKEGGLFLGVPID
jgi:hypothetical protein